MVPTEWYLGIIYPLYIYNGLVSETDNYRGISLLSYTSKLFTSCLYLLLSCNVEKHILGHKQAGFREGYNTMDHVFVIHVVIQLYKSVHKRIYCTLIDYRK